MCLNNSENIRYKYFIAMEVKKLNPIYLKMKYISGSERDYSFDQFKFKISSNLLESYRIFSLNGNEKVSL